MIPSEVERVVRRLDEVLEEVGEHPDPRVRAAVTELADGLQRIHAEGLRRLAELLAEEPGRFRRALDDPVIANLFLLYDLAVVDEQGRTREALEAVRPLLEEHGCSLDLLGVEEGEVRIRLRGPRGTIEGLAEEVVEGVQRALEKGLPGFRKLEVEGPVAEEPEPIFRSGDPGWEERFLSGEPVSMVPRKTIRSLERRLEGGSGNGAGAGPPGGEDGETRRVSVAPVEEVEEEGLHGSLVEGFPVLLLRASGGLRAYRNACPGSILPLHLGERSGGAVVCPWHGCRFDPESGARLEGEGPGLEPLPVEVENGTVRVEIV